MRIVELASPVSTVAAAPSIDSESEPLDPAAHRTTTGCGASLIDAHEVYRVVPLAVSAPARS